MRKCYCGLVEEAAAAYTDTESMNDVIQATYDLIQNEGFEAALDRITHFMYNECVSDKDGVADIVALHAALLLHCAQGYTFAPKWKGEKLK